MKKIGKCKIIIVIIIGLLLFCLYNNNEDERVRIRVISNSNNYTDLYYKEEVKDIVCSIIKADDSINDVKSKLSEVEMKVKEYGRINNLEINVDFGLTTFPPKQLNGKLISGGDYLTLLVTIGKGLGNNYWTILYPEYFGYTFEEVYSGEVEIRSYIYDLINNVNKKGYK